MHEPATGVLSLLGKYLELKALRESAELADAPRDRLVRLARRFPGALRELDQLPMPVIERRIAALEALLAQGGALPQWMRLQLAYHGLLRVVLRIKRMALGAEPDRVAAILAELRVSYDPDADEPSLAFFDRVALTAILTPPQGRLNPWVFDQVAARCGVRAADVHAALFGDEPA